MKKNLFRLFAPLRVIEKDIMKEQFSTEEIFIFGFVVPFVFIALLAVVEALRVIFTT